MTEKLEEELRAEIGFANWDHPVFDGPDKKPKPLPDLNTEADE